MQTGRSVDREGKGYGHGGSAGAEAHGVQMPPGVA